MADAFIRAKLRLQDRGMHDGRLTPSSRLVFYEILQHVNRVSGDAWPSERRLADRLQIDVKTVKRALKPICDLGYIVIEKKGRHNTYRPLLDGPTNGDKLPPVQRQPVGDNLSDNRGHLTPSIEVKNGPLSSLKDPLKKTSLRTRPPPQWQKRPRPADPGVPTKVVYPKSKRELKPTR